ncbi:MULTISPECIES: polysaccharide biosynthesis protein [Methylomicrobium]|uniref:Putative nucleoside-diphosphate sugar epimerase n=1 Tax=Methylomicrobium album BG8 TaxID=686340 RepID=H8GP93_METAL|nr:MULTISPECIES: nucleoside-diphosphate sugar epimerase/dehydratase [Methylomicrobium]EIC29679.1 putative nucleoside-diphosphate sugar epimerase [Methylomicrobium album BG8]
MKSRLAHWFIGQPRSRKALILIGADVVFAVLALWSAFSLRWGILFVPRNIEWTLIAVAPMLAVPIFIRLGLYRAIIRYIEIKALWTIVQAVALYAGAFAAIYFLPFIFYESGIRNLPRTVPILNWLIMTLLVGSSRFFARWWLGDTYARLGGGHKFSLQPKKKVLIYGAGSGGVQLASALSLGREFEPVAFIDDDSSLHKHKIHGLRIYPFSALSYLIDRYAVSSVLLAIPSAKRSRQSELIRMLEPYAVHVLSMPCVSEIAEGKITFDSLREVGIEDLLGRDPVTPNPDLLHANITGKTVMVTGAGGSIGSELCRQLVALQPSALVLFELSEYALYAIERELLSSRNGGNERTPIYAILGSVTDAPRLTKICKTFKVQTIYHAAAYKHVPIVEHNPVAAIRNNIFGTLRSAEAAVTARVETFVLISTDKAVRPTNTMGATKRFAELILQAFSAEPSVRQSTRFTMVRFGNVLGSSGSVVPLFKEQIKHGGPVTVTDPNIIRYFMTIPEAAQLVIQAGAMGGGGDVFVLDMGEPVRILDLAKRMIHLSGLEIKDREHPDGEIEIRFTGLRPGEKLYEELLIGNHVTETEHPRIMRAEEHVIAWADLRKRLECLDRAAERDDHVQIREILLQAVSGFAPQCGIEDLLWKRAQSGAAMPGPEEIDKKKPPFENGEGRRKNQAANKFEEAPPDETEKNL